MFNPSLEGYSGHTRDVGKKSWWKSLVANKKDCGEKKNRNHQMFIKRQSAVPAKWRSLDEKTCS